MAIYLKTKAFFIFRPWAEQITKKSFRFNILETSYLSQGDTHFCDIPPDSVSFLSDIPPHGLDESVMFLKVIFFSRHKKCSD